MESNNAVRHLGNASPLKSFVASLNGEEFILLARSLTEANNTLLNLALEKGSTHAVSLRPRGY